MTHQLTNSDANVSATPQPNGRKKAPQLSTANNNQKDFFCESKPDELLNRERPIAYSTTRLHLTEAATVPGYILPHNLAGEQQRLGLMSELLNSWERAHIERLGVRPGWRCLEIGCGNGSISRRLTKRVAPSGQVTASDIDISYVAGVRQACLEIRQLEATTDEIEQGALDFVVARAVLHHLPSAQAVVRRLAAALKPGGVLLSVEPDFLPATVAEPESMRKFWLGWLKWSVEANIDYFIGHKIACWMDSLGLVDVGGEGHTPWAAYWLGTMLELQMRIVESGNISTKPSRNSARCTVMHDIGRT